MGGRDPCLPVGDAPPSSLQIQVCLVLEQCAPTSLFQRLSGPAGRDRVGHVARVARAVALNVARDQHVTRLSRERTVRTAPGPAARARSVVADFVAALGRRVWGIRIGCMWISRFVLKF